MPDDASPPEEMLTASEAVGEVQVSAMPTTNPPSRCGAGRGDVTAEGDQGAAAELTVNVRGRPVRRQRLGGGAEVEGACVRGS